jgi:hypothetical protein
VNSCGCTQKSPKAIESRLRSFVSGDPASINLSPWLRAICEALTNEPNRAAEGIKLIGERCRHFHLIDLAFDMVEARHQLSVLLARPGMQITFD